jgi:hypothetical protein
VATQLAFFMSPDDEVELFRRLEGRELDLWPELIERGYTAPKVNAEAAAAMDGEGYYLALGDVQAYPIKRGPGRGRMKIDEVASTVVHFQRSLLDEDGQLRSGHFWAELEASGDLARTGGKPAAFHRLVRDLQELLKSRYRRSQPAGFFIGPGAARLSQAGTLLREAGRKGGLYVPFR